MSQVLAMPTSQGVGQAPDMGRAGGVTLLRSRFTPSVIVATALVALAFVALFNSWLTTQIRISLAYPSDWGHALLVPVISGYIIYQRRAELARTPACVFWPGLPVMLLGIATYLFSLVGVRNDMIAGWAVILSLFGLVLLLLGPAMMRLLILPIAYLVFAVSISGKIMTRITTDLQFVASEGAYAMLRVLGLTVDIKGTVLTIYSSAGAAIPLNIAEQCSGLRMLVAFVALGAAVALVACREWWQRVVMVIMAVPVALFMNMMRVVVLAVASLWNPQLAEGEAHMFIGTLLLIPGFFLYMLILWILQRSVTPAPPSPVPVARSAPNTPPTWRLLASPALLTAVILMGGSALGFNTAMASLKIYLKKQPIYAPGDRQVRAVPAETASWKRIGSDGIEKEAVIETLGTQNYLNRQYMPKPGTAAEGMPILDVHLAYYTGTVDTVPHVPERCLVGGGMTMDGQSRTLPLPLDSSRWILNRDVPDALNGRVYQARTADDPALTDLPSQRINLPFDAKDIRFRITPFMDPESGRKLYAGYFFIANGGTVSSAEGVRELAFNLTDDYAYYLKVQISSSGVASEEELAAAAGSLLSELLPEIMRCTPDWVSVTSGTYPDDNPRRALSPPDR
ncbi:MAG: exosortase [Phycisphaeraceae bacterium]|nr:exosortase [Phycisphaeraceae bacterium]